MNNFEQQINKQIYTDNKEFSKAAKNLKCIISEDKFNINGDIDNSSVIAVDQILRYYGIKEEFNQYESSMTLNEVIDNCLCPHGIMYKDINIKGKWYTNCVGPIIYVDKNNNTFALLPKKISGYYYYDYNTGQNKKINKENVSNFSGKAMVFFKPLPQKKLTLKDLIKFIISTISFSDYLILGLITAFIALIGLLIPAINNYIFSYVVTNNNFNVLYAAACALFGIIISTSLISISKSLVIARLKTKLDMTVESASMTRTLTLSPSFFKKYTSGELSSRVQAINDLCSMIEDIFLNTGLTSIFSLVYIGSIIKYAPALVIPALLIFFFTFLVLFLAISWQIKITKKRMLIEAKQRGLEFSLISGIQKLKVSNSEQRAFTKWMNLYSKNAKLQYDPPLFIKIYNAITIAITLLGTILLYYFAVVSNVSVASYMAFNVSFGLVQGAFASITNVALTISNFKPKLELIKPILNEIPETSSNKKIVKSLSGKIELKNISFRYDERLPYVINNLNLKIDSGEYVGIVGKTGCGKSTLIRLLLGFEEPNEGNIYYDNIDLNNLDLMTLRRNISTVLQGSKLFHDSIYNNISISDYNLSLEKVWKAAKMAGIDKDIENMPMGMNTIISETANGGISGGQKQRLLIARSFASESNILIFDEATSALDNLSQAIILKSLKKINCTRIVIAHRLSTIKECDRILFLDKGNITEEGTYDQLIKQNASFANFVKHQIIK